MSFVRLISVRTPTYAFDIYSANLFLIYFPFIISILFSRILWIPSLTVSIMKLTYLMFIYGGVKFGSKVAALLLPLNPSFSFLTTTLSTICLTQTTVTNFTCRCRFNVYILTISVQIALYITIYCFHNRTTLNRPVFTNPSRFIYIYCSIFRYCPQVLSYFNLF